MALKVLDVQALGGDIKERVTFAMTPYTQEALRELIKTEDKTFRDPLFTSQRKNKGKAITTDHYRALVKQWLALARLDISQYGSHSLRRTKIALIYKKTGNLKAAQVLLGHKSIQHTQNYLSVEEDQALEIARQFEGYFR